MSSLRRVRTADGRRVVDVTDWCRIEHLAPEELPRDRSIYAALAERGLAVDHGVAHLTPRNADGDLARRLGVPRGTLLLTIDQVDRTADGVAVLVSREHHVADAFTFTPAAARPRRGGSAERRRPLVVGVDVGSQGTCAQALEPDGTLVATSYAAARAQLPAGRLGRAGPRRVDGRARRHARARSATPPRGARSSRCRSARSSTAWSPPTPTASRCARR